MTAAVTTCPKCGHVRSATASVPDWQCPGCGIAYAKVSAGPAEKEAVRTAPDDPHLRPDHESASAKAEREAIPDSGQRGSPGAPALILYVTLAGLGFFASTFGNKVWIPVLSVISVASFGWWLYSYKKKRAFEDVPTSRIASAAQGYVEIRGKVEKAPGCALVGALTKKPCVWYHYKIVERGKGNDQRERTIESKAYGVPFVLRDETGECLVHPSAAEVTCNPTDTWVKGQITYTEAAISPGDTIYIIGSFSTQATAPDENLEQKTAALLKSWLAEPQAFFSRFDADRDGRIGAQELARARVEARSELAHRSVNQGGLHALRKSEDGRPFLIFSATNHDDVVKTYSDQVKLHLLVLIASIVFLAYNLVAK